jgi:predicted Rossmann-fold nucleotide-binding protein
MQGTLGTLTELCIIWNLAILGKIAGYESPRILCYKTPWAEVIEANAKLLNLPAEHLEKITYVENSDDVMKFLSSQL